MTSPMTSPMTSLNTSLNTAAPAMRPQTRFSKTQAPQPSFSGQAQTQPPRKKGPLGKVLLGLLAGTAALGAAFVWKADDIRNWARQEMFELRCAETKERFQGADVHCNPETGGILVDLTPKFEKELEEKGLK